jgi:hypothetical protein
MIEKNTTDYIFCSTHTDTEKQKLWERMRLESLVVIAVNDEYWDPTRRISTKKKNNWVNHVWPSWDGHLNYSRADSITNYH